MKKLITAFSFLLVLSLNLFANVFVVNDSTTNLGANTSFDLSKSYSAPTVAMTWNAKDENGNVTIGSENYLGMFGTKNCTHRIKITIQTDGKFVSQSDPTKYREFSVSGRAVYGTDGVNTVGNLKWMHEGETMSQSGGVYYAGHALQDTDYWPNTGVTGTSTWYSPRTDGTKQYVNANRSSANIKLYYIDLGISMAPLTTESMKHLSESDDYMATITITWECAEPDAAGTSCSAQGDHYGSKTIILRGYYGDSGSATNDAAYVYVIPNNNSTSIDIQALATQASSLNIGELQVHTAAKTTTYSGSGTGKAYDWGSNTKVWASSTPVPTAAGNQFLLAQVGGSKTIPYVVSVWDSSDTNKLVTFDGTGYCGGTTFRVTGNTLNIGTYGTQTLGEDRYGNKYSDIQFYGNIHIEIPNPPSDLLSNIESYSGAYTSYVYFNIMTNL